MSGWTETSVASPWIGTTIPLAIGRLQRSEEASQWRSAGTNHCSWRRWVARIGNGEFNWHTSNALLLVKNAAKQVTQQMAKEKKEVPTILSAACKLSWAMRYVRALEQGHWRRAAEARSSFPGIGEKVRGWSDKEVCAKNMEGTLHTWILELAKDEITEELEEVRKTKSRGTNTELSVAGSTSSGNSSGSMEERLAPSRRCAATREREDGHGWDDQHLAETFGPVYLRKVMSTRSSWQVGWSVRTRRT